MSWKTGLAALMALACLAAALGLAVQHPLGAGPAVAGVLTVSLLARYFWILWPAWMLALLPLAAGAPWTGWLWLGEWDLWVLASAAGGYAAISGPHRQPLPAVQPPWRRELRWRSAAWVSGLALLVSLCLAAELGIQDAGGWALGLYDTPHEPGMALRSVKAALAMGLMLPLWLRSARRAPQALTPALLLGVGALAALSAAGVLIEHLRYQGWQLSALDYELSGAYWEAHFGAAVAPAMLVLCLPFAVLAVMRRRSPLGFVVSSGALILSLLALLALWSAKVGLALVASSGLMAYLSWRQRQMLRSGVSDPASSWFPGKVPTDADRPASRGPAFAALALLCLLGGAVAWRLQPLGGSRAVWGIAVVVMLLMLQPGPSAQATQKQRGLSFALGGLVALALVGLTLLIAEGLPRVSYLAFALASGLSLLLARWTRRGQAPWNSPLADALRAMVWLWALGLVAVMSWTWAGEAVWAWAWWPLLVLALAWPLSQDRSLGGAFIDLGWRSRLAGVMALLLGAAALSFAAPGGGMGALARWGESHWPKRLQHWGEALDVLEHRQAWGFGVGAGRFAALYQANAPLDMQPPDYRWRHAPDGPLLRLAAGTHSLAASEWLRLNQHIAAAPPDLRLRLQARAAEPVSLRAEVCQKHLFEPIACRSQDFALATSAQGWRTFDLPLGGSGELERSGPWSPGLVFSLALTQPGQRVDLRALSLQGRDGVELLRNGDLAQDLAHWFPSAHRNPWPWQLQSLPLHVLLEQGAVGLALGAWLLTLALARLGFGSARLHPLAPALAASLLGFAVLGLTETLVDSGRVAFLALTLLALGLGLRATPPVQPAPAPAL
ncbi:hypothetical protein [Inhella inkyongensis]|nr:hypothetical protein [Inhella inkyongensis]